MRNLNFVIVLSLLVSVVMFGQIRPDTAVTLEFEFQEIGFESLVEQTPVEEDFTLFDIFDSIHVQLFQIRSRFIQKLQRSKGYENKKYLGSPQRLYQRIKLLEGYDYSAGLLLEKDPGEQRLADFMSGFFAAESLGPINNFVLGDYVLETGQGLVLWRGYNVMKGANVVAPVKRRGRRVVPNKSSDENFFLRGAALLTSFDSISVLLFYSKRNLGATVDTSLQQEFVTSFYTSGYFRTETELAKRNQVSEQLFGGNISIQFNEKNKVGFTGYTTRFSKMISLSEGKRFFDNRANVISADYSLRFFNAELFGEWARGSTNSIGGISGVLFAPVASMQIITAVRNYPYDFVSFHANGFGERGGTYNELGYYLGLRVRPLRRVQVSAFFDQFEFPSPTFTSKFSSGGHELFIQCDASLTSPFDLSVRYRRKSVDQREKVHQGNITRRMDDIFTKQSIRLHADYTLSRNVTLRGRFEFVDVSTQYSNRHETGFLIYHDVRLRHAPVWLFNFRLIFFKTDSYDAGIAEYENDLPGVLSVPRLYGQGIRWYALVKYSIVESFTLSLKYSYLIRDDVKKLGSGLDELPSNYDNRIGVQIDFRF